ncbi:hypothetical protein PAPYR_4781 [Paratrimastix pyriformis]|uniref:F-box domain-containing protein n=1 Tax=Paratrimastix pyriformis TaxID=342808 RepID=A0ABQ8ULD6_9EUKA|nr:hypothetical protein PAPYR_4781 [Paratrimastix pyriformis]
MMMDRFPDEIIALIYQKMSTGKTLTVGSLVSRRFRDVLWNDNHLWQLAYTEDYGDDETQMVELGLNHQNLRQIFAPPPAEFSWRRKYREHRDFFQTVLQDRKKQVKEKIRRYRRDRGVSSDLFLNWVAWAVMSPLMNAVAIPLLFTFLILRAEGVIGWSFHAVLAPADYMFLCGMCLFGFFALTAPQTQALVLWFIAAIFPVGIATIHWAAARGDWIATSGATDTPPPGLNWMYVFSPGVTMALLAIILTLVMFFANPPDRHDDRVIFAWIGVPPSLLVLAFLVLLGYKLQWGSPGFTYAYVFFPLWLLALGIEAFLVLMLSPCRSRSIWDCVRSSA